MFPLRRIPLPSARKAEVDEDPVHFGVARTKAAHILSCMLAVLACDCLHDINHVFFETLIRQPNLEIDIVKLVRV